MEIKKVSLTTPIWELEKVVDICNEYSKQGYQLEKVKVIGKSTFVKDDSVRYVYAVDFNPAISKAKKGEYLELFKDQGWEFVDETFNKFAFFRKEYKENTPEDEYKIYTDKETISEFYKRVALLLKVIIGIFIIDFILVIIRCIDLLVATPQEQMSQLIFPGIILILTIICFIPITIMLKRGLKKLQEKSTK